MALHQILFYLLIFSVFWQGVGKFDVYAGTHSRTIYCTFNGVWGRQAPTSEGQVLIHLPFAYRYGEGPEGRGIPALFRGICPSYHRLSLFCIRCGNISSFALRF